MSGERLEKEFTDEVGPEIRQVLNNEVAKLIDQLSARVVNGEPSDIAIALQNIKWIQDEVKEIKTEKELQAFLSENIYKLDELNDVLRRKLDSEGQRKNSIADIASVADSFKKALWGMEISAEANDIKSIQEKSTSEVLSKIEKLYQIFEQKINNKGSAAPGLHVAMKNLDTLYTNILENKGAPSQQMIITLDNAVEKLQEVSQALKKQHANQFFSSKGGIRSELAEALDQLATAVDKEKDNIARVDFQATLKKT